MNWEIGELKQIKGEWYQCVEGNCAYCSIEDEACGQRIINDVCKPNRIFKKLEKVGEPYTLGDKRFQKYKVFHTPYIYNKIDCSWQSFADPYYIGLEVKQNKKEVMYIHKVAMDIDDRDYLLDKLESILHDTHCQQYKDEICEAFSKYIATENVSDLKPFDLNAAKAGKPVCTRDGRKTRIVCFDTKGSTHPIVALIEKDEKEVLSLYMLNGKKYEDEEEWKGDLMILPEKRSGYAKIRKDVNLYNTKEEADRKMIGNDEYVTAKVCWEE